MLEEPLDSVASRIVFEDSPDGCWLWAGHIKGTGYGRIRRDGRFQMVHRWLYSQLVEEVPADIEIDHLCRVRNCVNPDHLEPVTRRENVARSTNPARFAILHDTCAKGHALTEDNVYRNPSSPNTRRCRICCRETRRVRHARFQARRLARIGG